MKRSLYLFPFLVQKHYFYSTFVPSQGFVISGYSQEQI